MEAYEGLDWRAPRLEVRSIRQAMKAAEMATVHGELFERLREHLDEALEELDRLGDDLAQTQRRLTASTEAETAARTDAHLLRVENDRLRQLLDKVTGHRVALVRVHPHP